MATAASIPQAPLSQINTTPLIDVLLVLLIMLVITIPAATDSVDVDLPGGGKPAAIEPNPVMNRVALTNRGAILWNGTAVDRAQLAALLHETTLMPVEPELQYRPDADASYDLAVRVLDTIKRSGVSRFGFVGNEDYREFGK